jgi:hypothetical protein
MWSSVNGTKNHKDTTGGSNMISLNRIFFAGAIVSAVAAALMASGCAVGGTNRPEVRVITTLEAGAPQMMVSGPARLLHVDVHGRQSLNVYAVKRGADGTANCADKASSEVVSLRQGGSNDLNMVVRDGEAVCVANTSTNARSADVSWHARRGSEAPAEAMHASNL